uniref:Protein FAM136A n=1 Tax=Mantoniella antarctica TaxID=81844 RepID=A0A7S0X5S1_9CHLO|mmetsp:Transcript_21150/g.52265  ORF Transcript_21150/g.52265 Transcript_21150/m.52265 type:complete len:121 (+) Transcript_21150:49-411(+)
MSKGVEELQTKLTGLVEELDHKVFRPEQKVAFQCSATCCDLRGPQGEMAQCLEQCGARMAHHQQAVNNELQAFQGRMQRCGTACQDRQGDQAMLDKCVNECAVFYQKELGQLRPKLLKSQ